MADQEKMFAGGMINGVNLNARAVMVSTAEGKVSNRGVERPSGQALTLTVDENTTITVNRRYRQVGDLAAGQKLAKVYYVEAQGGGRATVIHAVDEELERRLRQQQPREKSGAGSEQAKPAI